LIVLHDLKNTIFFYENKQLFIKNKNGEPVDPKAYPIYKNGDTYYIVVYTKDEISAKMFFMWDTHGFHPDKFEEYIQSKIEEELDDNTIVGNQFIIKLSHLHLLER
jgi:hypothetical protein